MSKVVSTRPDNDLVLLGGPAKNEFSKRFIEHLTKDVPELKLMFDDDNCILEVDGEIYDSRNLDIHDGVPRKDIGPVIVWHNPFSSERKRVIYCAGMTSYGTSGCAAWLFEDVLTVVGKKAKAIFKSVGKKAPCFIGVLEMDIVNGSVVAINEKQLLKIRGKCISDARDLDY